MVELIEVSLSQRLSWAEHDQGIQRIERVSSQLNPDEVIGLCEQLGHPASRAAALEHAHQIDLAMSGDHTHLWRIAAISQVSQASTDLKLKIVQPGQCGDDLLAVAVEECNAKEEAPAGARDR